MTGLWIVQIVQCTLESVHIICKYNSGMTGVCIVQIVQCTLESVEIIC